MNELKGKVVPHDINAEQAVLGAIALSPEVIDEVSQIVKPESFFSSQNRLIYSAIQELCEADNAVVDVISITAKLKSRGDYVEVGGAAYLNEIMQAVPHTAHAEYYAKIVREKFVLRQLMQAAEQIYKQAQDEQQDADIDRLMESAEKKILRIAEGIENIEQMTFSDVLDDTFAEIFRRMESGGRVGISTGITGLDRHILGWVATELVVLAARPGMGKTALICNFAMTVAELQRAVLLFSLEMSRQEISERLLTISSEVNGHRLRRGEIDDYEQHQLMSSAERMRSMQLIIDDAPGRTMHQIAAIARRQHRRNPLGLIVVDYLQLIESDNPKLMRQEHIAATTRRLKFLAKELQVPILVLSQLNRGLESREDKRPKLSDLRESGAIEQDADIVMFLHRPEVYDPNDRPGEADLIVSKNRHGPIGQVPLSWHREKMTFTDKIEELAPGLF